MKKLILMTSLSALLLLTVTANAVQWHGANQATVFWRATTTTAGGAVIPTGDSMSYRVFLKKDQVVGDGTLVGETGALLYVLTFPSEGRWVVGIQSVRTPKDDPQDIKVSTIVWSDSNDVVAVPAPFGYIYYEAPKAVEGFAPKSPE